MKYSSGSGTAATNRLIQWEIDQNYYDLVRSDPSKASITIKWKIEGAHCRIKATKISLIQQGGSITYGEATATVKIQSTSVGDITLTGPDKTLCNSNIQIGAEIKNTIGNFTVSISGNDISASNWVSTGQNIGYFPVSFRTPGIKTVTVTVSGSGSTSASATKNISVYPNIITGEEVIALNGQQTYKLTNAPADNYTWSVPNGLQIISGQGTSQIIVKHNGSYMGNGYVQASFSGFTVRKNLTIGAPDINKVTATLGSNNTLWSYQTSRNECRAYYSGPGEILEYKWEAFDWEVFNPLTVNKSIVFLKSLYPGSPTANIVLSARNSAGWSSGKLLGAKVNNSYSRYAVSYTSNNITVTENTADATNPDIVEKMAKRDNKPIAYELYNINNVSVAKKGTIDKMGGTIDISNLPKGFYIFSLIVDASTRQTMKIAIK